METPKTQQQKQQQPVAKLQQEQRRSRNHNNNSSSSIKTLKQNTPANQKLYRKKSPKKTQPNPITEMHHHNSKDFSHEFIEKSKSGVIPKPPLIYSGPAPHALFFPCNLEKHSHVRFFCILLGFLLGRFIRWTIWTVPNTN
jgi:hypothetical protein